ncbi:MAG TPA: chemotaxis protein CheW [Anaeromyxobacter sp.]|nr:chemotaxis protein CheW [Anaeromyxobacter sp.]
MATHEIEERRQYLSFTLAGSDYAVGILQVKEILQYETVTRVPSVPPSVRGVINLRGAVVPVIDLAVKFGLPETQVTSRTCVLIVEAALEGERAVMGVLADAVREVLELGSADVEPPPSFGTQVRVEFITGMAKVGKGFVLLLDLDKVVSAREKAAALELAQGDGSPVPVTGKSAAVAFA